MEDDRNAPLSQNPGLSMFFVGVFLGFKPPKPFQTARTCFFYPGKARQCRFSWIQVRFRPFSGFRDLRFVPQDSGPWILEFSRSGVWIWKQLRAKPALRGVFFSKTTPPWISRAKEGRDFQKKTCKSSTACLGVWKIGPRSPYPTRTSLLFFICLPFSRS